MDFLDNPDGIEDDEEKTSNAIEDIMAYFIQINTDAGENALEEASSETA